MKRKRSKYLNNKDMLREINNSKLSFCYLIDDSYKDYDLIVTDIKNSNDKIIYIESIEDLNTNKEIVQTAKENKASKLSMLAYNKGVDQWYLDGCHMPSKPKQISYKVEPESIRTEDLVIRVMSFDHVPLEPGRKKNPKTKADHHTKCNFPPYKHYVFKDGVWQEVLRSHWEGGFENGAFSVTHGKISNSLALMMMKLCDKYSMRFNWRNYTYVDEMRSSALVQLSQVGLQFDESKSLNPFAYFTTVVNNSFTRVLNLEKRNQNIRDDILQDNGYMPSFSRQITDEKDQQNLRAQDEEFEKQQAELKNAGYNY